MYKQDLYTIGQISKVCMIPIQTLRYYDRIDLLKPAIVNEETGYRYYSNKQILHIKIIQQLKEQNFSLHEIKEYLKREDLSVIIDLFNNKCLEIREQIDALKKIERQLTTRIKNLKNNNKSDDEPYIEIKNIEEKNVVFTRYNASCNPDTFAMRYNELQNIILREGLEISGNFMAIFYDHYSVFDYNNADIEVCIPITNSEYVSKYARKLPAGQYVTILHKGPYNNASKSYSMLLEWIRKNSYEINGPTMENYIIDISLTKNPQNYITEFQIPVKKC